jgi:hypothetical protein
MMSIEAPATVPSIKLWYDRAFGVQYIDLDDPRALPGLQALVNAKLISSQRMVAVLAGELSTSP